MQLPDIIQSEETVLRIVDRFISSSIAKASSKKAYCWVLRAFFKFLKETDSKTNAEEVIAKYNQFLEQKGLRPTTIRFYFSPLRQFFKHLDLQGFPNNIASTLKNPPLERSIRFCDDLSIAQIKQLLRVIPKSTLQGLRDRAIVEVMLRTGLKACEIVKATFKDFEVLNEPGKMRWWVGEKGERGSDFVVLLDETIKPIMKYVKAREDLTGTLNLNDPIFVSLSNRNYGALTIYSISRLIKKYLRKAGISSINGSSQVLRHTYSLLALQGGASAFELYSGLRYKNLDSIRIYLRDMEKIEKISLQSANRKASIESDL